MVNIAVSHTAAGGSIPPIGIAFYFYVFKPRLSLFFVVSIPECDSKKKDMTPLVSHRGVAANAIVIDSSATEYTLQYYGLCIDTRVRDTVTMAGLIPIIHENASSIINIGHPRCS